MAGNDTSAKGRRAIRFCCATPTERCNGTKCGKQAGRTHTSTAEALACQRNYLISQGYKQLSTREFLAPVDPVTGESSGVLVLDKKAPRAQAGKSSTTYMSQPLKVRPSLPSPR